MSITMDRVTLVGLLVAATFAVDVSAVSSAVGAAKAEDAAKVEVPRDGTKAEPDQKPSWPQNSGPYGNWNPVRCGHKLVDDWSQARVLWKSDSNILGHGKTTTRGVVGGYRNPKDRPCGLGLPAG